jgi:DNA-binding NarL/FixJ family response regulator
MSTATLPRVMIATEDAFELMTVSASLRLHGVNIVAEVQNQIVAENTFRSLQPEVVLFDLLFADSHVIEMIIGFRKTNPELGIVIMTAGVDLRLLGIPATSIPRGVQIILKSSIADLAILNSAIIRSLESSSIAETAQWVTGNASTYEGNIASIIHEFTDIQVATLRLLAQGLSNSEIAKVRFVSEKSVEQIVARIAQHLHVSPDRTKNLRVVITGEYFKCIGAPRHL